MTFLANRPQYTGYCTGTPAITAGTFTPIVIDTDGNDNWSGHSPLGQIPQDYVCQAPGWYLAEGYVPFNYTGGTQFAFGAAIGSSLGGTFSVSQGQSHLLASGHFPGVAAADIVRMVTTGPAGTASSADYIQLLAYTTASGVSLLGATPNFPVLAVRWACTGSASTLAVPANAAFPVPPSYVDQAWLNTNIRDTMAFLANPPALRYSYAPGTQTLPGGTWPTANAVTLNTRTLDNYSAGTLGTWIVPQPGVYCVLAQVGFVTPVSAQGGTYAAGVTISGTTTWGQAVSVNAGAVVGTVAVSLSDRFRLSTGSTVSLAGFQNTGASRTLTAATRLVTLWEEA